MSDFFTSENPTDLSYLNLRDRHSYEDIREFIKSLWALYEPYADQHFRSEIGHHFHQRFWEMYLGCVLLNNGHSIARSEIGPDFNIQIDASNIWIEAVAPGAGTGDDMVNDLVADSKAHLVPDANIILRIRSAIEDKHEQLHRFKDDGLIGMDDPYVIAVNGRGIPMAFLDSEDIPYIIKCVLPFGQQKHEYDVASKMLTRVYYEYRSKINKRSGCEVSTDIFLDEEYNEISAILYSAADVANHPSIIGSEFILIHNPKALNPLNMGTFQFGREFWVEQRLEQKVWSEN